MTKKIIVTLVILLILGLVFSFLVYQLQKKKEEVEEVKKEELEKSKEEIVPGEIITAHLEKVLLPSPDSEGHPERLGVSSSFQPGDWILVQLEADIKQEGNLTLELLNESGEKLDLYLPEMKVSPRSRNYVLCCFRAPQVSGKYILKLLLNGKEAKTLEFEVIS